MRDFPVNVRRKNSETKSVYLGKSSNIGLFCFINIRNLFTGDELERFVDDNYSRWKESWITTGFEFDIKRLGDIEGIIKPPSLVSYRYY